MAPSDTTDVAGAVSRRALLREGTRHLDTAGRDAPRRTAEWLLADLLDCPRTALHTQPGRAVEPDPARRFRDAVRRRAEGEPLEHILGYADFRGLRIEVSPAVMVPRPETEEVVGTALQSLSDAEAPRVLDVGTGSGCIALALKHERPDAVVHACDVSRDALAIARANSARLGLDVHFAEADLFADSFTNRMPSSLDLLVSNPPYIPDGEAEALPDTVREHDPDTALFAGDDPLRYYRALLGAVPRLCAAGAAIVLETHADYARDVAALGRRRGLRDVQLNTDLQGRPRIVAGRWTAE